MTIELDNSGSDPHAQVDIGDFKNPLLDFLEAERKKAERKAEAIAILVAVIEDWGDMEPKIQSCLWEFFFDLFTKGR